MRRLIGTLLLGSLCALTPSLAAAASIYEASIALSLIPGPLPNSRVTFNLSPGTTFVTSNGFGAFTTTQNAVSGPGTVSAVATGIAGFPVPGGEQPDSLASSAATAIGFGSLTNPFATQPLSLSVMENWHLRTIGGNTPSNFARAHVAYSIQLDDLFLQSNSHDASGTGELDGSLTNTLAFDLAAGSHIMLITVEASGIAATPEPASILLAGSMLASILLLARRLRKRADEPVTVE